MNMSKIEANRREPPQLRRATQNYRSSWTASIGSLVNYGIRWTYCWMTWREMGESTATSGPFRTPVMVSWSLDFAGGSADSP